MKAILKDRIILKIDTKNWFRELMTLARVYLTGSSGFVGRALAGRLSTLCCTEQLSRQQLSGEALSLKPGSVLIHCAARTHILKDRIVDPLSEYRRVNRDLTLNLAKKAAEQGVSRFVFISSIKVNGESTVGDSAFSAESIPAPADAYAISKHEAEQALFCLAQKTSMEVVILRPPLVYGPGVGANFRRMMEWVARGIPLPLGAMHNRRSLMALDNLVDLIITAASHPEAGNRVFLGSDAEDVSVSRLLQLLGEALNKPVNLLPVPSSLVRLAAKCMGQGALASRLCDSLRVDSSSTMKALSWQPPVSLVAALEETADAYWREKHS